MPSLLSQRADFEANRSRAARHSFWKRDKERFEAIDALLESHADHHGKLRLEKERNRSRPVESAPVERAEIDFARLGFWPQATDVPMARSARGGCAM